MPRFPFFRPKLQDEISSELSFHLEMLVRRLESLGYTPAEARAEAARRMGDMNRVRADCTRAGEERQRNWNRAALLTGLKQDLHYALRSFRRAPLFTLLVVLTLALGIGATTSVFSLINGVLLTSLPYRSPGRILQVNEVVPDGARWELSYPAFRDLRERSRSFSHLGGYFGGLIPVTVGRQTLELGTFYLTPDLLPALGVSPELGRGFSAEEAGDGDADAALISHGLWVRQFGADPEVLGRQIHLGGTAVTIVGVMPDRFYFPDQSAEVWLPFGPPQPFMENRTVHIMRVVGRLKNGVGAEQAREDVGRVFLELQRDFPGADPGHTGTTETLADVMLGGVRLPLLTLFAGVVLVLLITCANVGGLILARAGARGEEIAVRTALGAGRFRLLRQLAAESLLLSVAGGAAGALLAGFAVRWVVPRLPGSLPQIAAIGVDARVLAFTAAVALLAGLGFALIPALGLDGRGHAEALRGGGRRVQGSHARRGALVMAEVALSIVLVVAAGLLIRSFLRVQSVDPGFSPRNLLLVTTLLPPDRYDPSGAVEFYRALPERLEAIPGVVEASAVSNLPISGGDGNGYLTIEGQAFSPGETPQASYRRVLPNYFHTMGIPLRAGREFEAGDDGTDGGMVVLINQTMARRYFPDASPLGRRIKVGPPENEPWLTIVGVVGDVHNESLEREPALATYEPLAQRPRRTMQVIIRTSVDPLSVAPAMRSALNALDPEVPLYGLTTMHRRLAASVASRRFNMVVLGAFALMALLLAGIGVYGITAFAASQRRRELGIRLALGATPGGIMRLVAWQSVRLALAGAALGLLGALAVSRLLRGLLFGVRPSDPATFAIATATLGALAVVAAILPSWRAARMDPSRTLAEER